MTAAEPSQTRGRGRARRGGRGGGRRRAPLIAAAALLIAPSTAAAATQEHSLRNRIQSEGRTVASLSDHLTFHDTTNGKYDADFWIHNGTASSSSVYFKFHYMTGAVHTSRTWGNLNGPGGEPVHHMAWIGREGQTVVPRMRFITVVLAAGGRTSTCHYPNRFVLGNTDYGRVVTCGTSSPPPPPTSRGIRIPRPMTPPSPAPVPAPATQPTPPPPVVMPGPAPVARPRSPRGCTPSDQPIVARLKTQRRSGRTVPRILSVAYWARILPTVQQPRRRDLRGLGRLKVARGRPFRVSLANGFPPGARVRIYARVRYRWRGERKVHVRATRRVVRICL